MDEDLSHTLLNAEQRRHRAGAYRQTAILLTKDIEGKAGSLAAPAYAYVREARDRLLNAAEALENQKDDLG